tara:strand:- start:326 stop:595 length:270 start_codon:yes stop_codon:yes gene_type:complete
LHFSGPIETTYLQYPVNYVKDNIQEKQMTPQILRRKDVEATVGLSRSTIYHLISEGLFPAPIKLGKRAVGWKVSDLEIWLNNREIAGSN